jgi:hypothetical protein
MVDRNELSEETVNVTKRELRSANIGILVGALIAIAGAAVFRDSSEATLQLVGLAAFVGGLAVYTVLDELTERKEKKTRQ